jgi:hypothetical protein
MFLVHDTKTGKNVPNEHNGQKIPNICKIFLIRPSKLLAKLGFLV